MNLFTYILIFTLIGSVFSLIGGILLLLNKKLTKKYAHMLSSFAAGALLGAVFFDLLPEGVHQAEGSIGNFTFFLLVLLGIVAFYILERVLHWHHNHDEETRKEPVVPMIVIGDTIHNFVDGIAIAAAFLISIPLGVITAIVVGLHEVPQEIGDFGILLKKGLSRRKVLAVNLLSAAVSLVGALLTYYIGSNFAGFSIIFVAIAAGFFLYISLSNLIPEIHHENRKGFALSETLALLGAIAITYFAINYLHAYLPEHTHNHNEIEIHEEANDNNQTHSETQKLHKDEYITPYLE